jgi:hypothetical protein
MGLDNARDCSFWRLEIGLIGRTFRGTYGSTASRDFGGCVSSPVHRAFPDVQPLGYGRPGQPLCTQGGHSTCIHRHARTPKPFSLRPGIPQAGFHPFHDQAALQLRNGAQGEKISSRDRKRRALRQFASGKGIRVYTVRVNRRWIIDASSGGSGAEFINHSCDPNLTVRKLRRKVLLYSYKKIRRGQELTLDYGFHCSCPCRCGSRNCRGTMCHIPRI